jgi:hypothetical protein
MLRFAGGQERQGQDHEASQRRKAARKPAQPRAASQLQARCMAAGQDVELGVLDMGNEDGITAATRAMGVSVRAFSISVLCAALVVGCSSASTGASATGGVQPALGRVGERPSQREHEHG